MIEKIDRNFLAEKVEKLETHTYSPEQNKLHFTGIRLKLSVPGCVTIDSAIDKVLSQQQLRDRMAYEYFGLDYIKHKVLNGKKLVERELENFIHEDFFPEVDRDEGENRRWSRWVTLVKEVDGRFFQVGYDQGLTESQPDSYDVQPVEVFKIERVVTKTVTEYVRQKPDETIHE